MGRPHKSEAGRILAGYGWTQTSIAREMGVGPSVISKYLCGAEKPSPRFKDTLKAVLGAAKARRVLKAIA